MGGGGRGGRDNINYLVKMITENKVFHFIFFCEIVCLCHMSDTIFDFYFPWFGNFSFCVCLCLCVSLSPSLSLSHMKWEVGRYVSEESNYSN